VGFVLLTLEGTGTTSLNLCDCIALCINFDDVRTSNSIQPTLFIHEGKGKGKVHLRTGHEVPEGEKRYSSTLSLTSALDGVSGHHRAPAALPPMKTRYLLYRKLGGP